MISTLFSKTLSKLVLPRDSLPALADTHAVTMMVVCLWYPNPDLLAGHHGFGYLIPQSTPFEQNPERALGVLFDSDAPTRQERPGTKLTVMMGGYHWDGAAAYPSHDEAIAMAKSVVQRHLRISASENETAISTTRLCRDCIPQQIVGHRARMSAAHGQLQAAFQGRLSVAGSSYTNVGVIPSMRAGFDAAMRVARGHGPPWFRGPSQTPPKSGGLEPFRNVEPRDHVGETGLQHFAESPADQWVWLRPSKMK